MPDPADLPTFERYRWLRNMKTPKGEEEDIHASEVAWKVWCQFLWDGWNESIEIPLTGGTVPQPPPDVDFVL